MVGTHLSRSRDRRERPLWKSNWAQGLWLILAALGLMVVVAVVLFLVT
jgi:hypothetical protein